MNAIDNSVVNTGWINVTLVTKGYVLCDSYVTQRQRDESGLPGQRHQSRSPRSRVQQHLEGIEGAEFVEP